MRLKWYVPVGLVTLWLLYVALEQWQQQQWRRWIGQKLMIDLHSFCPEAPAQTEPDCSEAVTELPPQLAQLINTHQIGGVVLFARNIRDELQLRQLTAALQASRAAQIPLWIAVDQEGGRVSRFPDAMAAAFGGNMALGATYASKATELAYATGQAQARQLNAFGMNLNFSPTVDVNSNPLNPVINVRAFGDQPQMVAELGIALASGLQQNGVLATFKHFPGHGDTSVDSHTGLPKVEHSRALAYAQDLAPFALAIKNGTAQAIMTAHIQYPALDSSEVVNTQGEKMLRPATLSKTILTDVLRHELGFDGVVFTDALNMAAIADFFSPEQALVETFAAGADVALMPLAIRTPADFERLDKMIEYLVQAMADGRLSADLIESSYQRIIRAKQNMNEQTEPVQQSAHADMQRRQEERALDLDIAHASVTVVNGQQLLPAVNETTPNRVWLAMPDAEKCQHFASAFVLVGISAQQLHCLNPGVSLSAVQFEPTDLLIGAIITPQQSAAEFGVIADLIASGQSPATEQQQVSWLHGLMSQAKDLGSTTALVALRSPYALPVLSSVSDLQLVSYGYQVRTDLNAEPAAVYQALVAVLTGKIAARGQLPVQLPTSTFESTQDPSYD